MSGKFFYKLLDERTLLDRLLNSQSRPEAWAEFLRRYSNLFFKVIWQHEHDHDDAIEKYLFVCTKFAENDLARLRKFQTDYGSRTPKLSTWLVAVAHNLCIDAHRAEHGRRRYPAALLRMSGFEQKVFRFYYWEGYSNDEVVHKLAATPERIREALEQIGTALGEAPGTSLPQFVRFDENMHLNEPESDLDGSSQEAIEWLSLLKEREQVVIRMKFWEEMSAREIVEILDLQSEQQVNSIMHNALKKLRAQSLLRTKHSQNVRAIQSKKI